MDKIYQVFVSSTYIDLQEERAEVMQALLELDCFPAGMELFPASNEDQWSLIKRVIDNCDYYILIIGGRYGSVDEDGMSYTEKEYRYALSQGKPIIAFLHKNPENIISKNTELTTEGREKLKQFRALAENKLVKYWENPAELGSIVSRSMINLIKQFPSDGWVRSNSLATESAMREILELRRENEELKQKLKLTAVSAPPETADLCQGDDIIDVTLTYNAYSSNSYNAKYLHHNVQTTWNSIFSVMSPHMTIECTENNMKKVIVDHLFSLAAEELLEIKTEKKYREISNIDILNEDFQKIKIQFKALGLIVISSKNHSVTDKNKYWSLTDYGDYIMTQLIAKRK